MDNKKTFTYLLQKDSIIEIIGLLVLIQQSTKEVQKVAENKKKKLDNNMIEYDGVDEVFNQYALFLDAMKKIIKTSNTTFKLEGDSYEIQVAKRLK